MGFPLVHFSSLGSVVGGCWKHCELSKNPYGYKTKPKLKQKKNKINRPHAESDSDQTLFPKFIMLESMEDTPITKLSPSIIEKTLNSLIKAKSVKK